jgi:formylglycine-generating enzyme required for sulfatase activity
MHRKPFLVLLLVLVAALDAGCPSSENGCVTPDAELDADATGDEGGTDADVPEVLPTCTPPTVSCGDGQHSEYGICVPDTDELAVSGGSFDMGAAGGTDVPLHNVTLAAFLIDRTEVTNARYQACVSAGCCIPPTYDGSYSGREPYFGVSRYDNYPVVFVGWDQARQYCAGLGKRLPTEAQWEFAARGTDGRTFPWGSNPPTTTLAHFDEALEGDTAQVAYHSTGASPCGAMDMAGNVWEWVADWYGETYYTTSPASDPPGPDTGIARVVRGGSFASPADQLFAYARMWFLPADSYSSVGFRCAW